MRKLERLSWAKVALVLCIALLLFLIITIFTSADLGTATLPVIGFLLAVIGLGGQLALLLRQLIVGESNRNIVDLAASLSTTAGAALTVVTFDDVINAAEGQDIVTDAQVVCLAVILVTVFVLSAVVTFIIRDERSEPSSLL